MYDDLTVPCMFIIRQTNYPYDLITATNQGVDYVLRDILQ